MVQPGTGGADLYRWYRVVQGGTGRYWSVQGGTGRRAVGDVLE